MFFISVRFYFRSVLLALLLRVSIFYLSMHSLEYESKLQRRVLAQKNLPIFNSYNFLALLYSDHSSSFFDSSSVSSSS